MNIFVTHFLTTFGYLFLFSTYLYIIYLKKNEEVDKNILILNLLTLIPIILHFTILYRYTFYENKIFLSLGNVISLIMVMTTLIYIIFSFFYKTYNLPLLILPLTSIFSNLSFVNPLSYQLDIVKSEIFYSHFFLSILAYSIFTTAFFHTILLLAYESNLTSGKFSIFLKKSRPLLTLENILFKIVFFGVLILSLALITGSYYSLDLNGAIIEFNHKTLFSFFSLITFTILLTGRYFWGWRGKKAINFTMIGFFFLILSYIGTRIVFEIIL